MAVTVRSGARRPRELKIVKCMRDSCRVRPGFLGELGDPRKWLTPACLVFKSYDDAGYVDAVALRRNLTEIGDFVASRCGRFAARIKGNCYGRDFAPHQAEADQSDRRMWINHGDRIAAELARLDPLYRAGDAAALDAARSFVDDEGIWDAGRSSITLVEQLLVTRRSWFPDALLRKGVRRDVVDRLTWTLPRDALYLACAIQGDAYAVY